MDVGEVEKAIRLAFKEVTLGDGVGLWQAQAIDDYETKSIQLEAREKDEKGNWENLSLENLSRCESSLSFFDDDGMRFHLPAFILAELHEEYCGSVMFHLSQCAKNGNFGGLSHQQKSAVVVFMEWCLTQECYEPDWPNIKQALDEVWKRS